jgi:hypothetical protein
MMSVAADLREHGSYEFGQGDYDKAVLLHMAAMD